MRQSVGPFRPASQNLPIYRTLSFILSTALVLLPVLPARAAFARAAADGRRGELRAAPAALPAAAPLVPSLTATKVDSFPDPDGDGKAEPGQTITYTVTITNNGTDATNVTFTDTVDPNTTLVPGSVSTQPVASDDSYNVLGNVRIEPNAAGGLLANDCDPDNGPSCSSAGLTASGPSTSAQGGNVTVNANGSFTYNPPAGYEGPDSFTYTVTDPTGKTDTATANFTVNDVVWFVDNAAANGDGRLGSPFNSLAPLNGGGDPDETDDVIFVHEGTGPYGGGIVLEDGQRLVGQGTSLDSALALFGITVPPHSAARPAASGNPTLANTGGNVVTLANGNTVIYLDASATAAASSAVFASGVAGTTTIGNVGLLAAGASGGITLVNGAGPVSVTNSTVACTSTGTAVLVNGGAAAVNFANMDVSQNGGRVVYVENRTGGTVLFDAASSVTGNVGTADAVTLVNNTSSVVTFAGPVNLNTNASGVSGLVADSTGGFTLNMTGAGNAVNSTGGAAVDIQNIAANISFATTFSTASNDNGVRVVNVTGSASFGNTTVNTSTATGVVLADNAAAIAFTDLSSAPAVNQRALHATNNTGTISSTGGVIITAGAAAVEVVGPGAASRTPLNLQLNTVSTTGGPNGIFLHNTSAPGSNVGLRVLGNTTLPGNCTLVDATCTGGRIMSTTGSDNTTAGIGVYLENADEVSLKLMHIDGHDNFAVRGSGVTAFKLDASVVDGSNGNSAAFSEGSVVFTQLLGTGADASLILASAIKGGFTDNVRVTNTAGTGELTIANSTIRDTNIGPTGNDNVNINVSATAAFTAYVIDSVFAATNGDHIQTSATNSATLNIVVARNNFSGGGGPNALLQGITISGGNAGSTEAVNFNVSNNTINGSIAGGSINVNKGNGAGNWQGQVTNNLVGTAGVPNSGAVQASAIRVESHSPSGALTAIVSGNTVREWNSGPGINTSVGDTGNINASLNVTVTGNNIANPGPSSQHGFQGNYGVNSAGTNAVCSDVNNNTINLGAVPPNGGSTIRMRQRNGSTVRLPGYAGANNDILAVTTFLNNQNTLTPMNSSSATVQTPPGGGFVGGAACAQPVVPAAPPQITMLEQTGAGPMLAGTDVPRQATPAAFSRDVEFGLLPSLGKIRRGFAYAERAQTLGIATVTGEVLTETTRAAAAAAPVTAALAGETVTVNIGTLKAGDSVTITFQVTVADPFPTNVQPPQVSNQGTVTADGGVSVLTDDPSVGGASDPTVTPILTPPTININDSTVAEPASGSDNMLFTVTLSHPYTHVVTVNFGTTNGGANPATAGTDYTVTNGSVSFAVGETFKTASVPVLADGTAGEGDETFLVDLSGAVNGTIGDGTATGTITDETVPSALIISELRTSGPGGAGNDFVELLNTTDSNITVPAGGYGLFKSGAACGDTPALVGTVPAGTVIPARGNYLFTGSAYSLANYGGTGAAAGDSTLTSDIEDDRNVGLFSTASLGAISSANRLDAVGFGGNTTGNCDLLREGTNLPAVSGSASEYAFVRKVTKGLTEDTSDNAADFMLVATDAPALVGSTTPTLGAPGPENLASPQGPQPCAAPSGSAHFGRDLLDTGVAVGTAPNTDRNNTPVTNGGAGTITFRRTFKNNTLSNVSSLRFRIVDLSTAPASASEADLRALSSTTTVVPTTGGPKTVQGTTVEQPPTQASGGGVNSSLVVTLGTPLSPGASVNLGFVFGVEQAGDYDIAFVLESLPGSGKDIWKLSGHTENGGHTDGGCNKAPIANAGTDQTVECTGNSQASVTLDGSGSTDPDGDTPLNFVWKEGATTLGTGQMLVVSLGTGSHTITLTVTDPSGDSSQDTVVVNVVDTTAPQVTAPPDVTVYTGPNASSCSAVVGDGTLGTGSATDSCEGPLPVNRQGVPAGNIFPVGTTQVTYSATDSAGKTGMDTQNVTVIDNTVPTVTAPPDMTVPADPGSCSATVNPGTATAADNCGVQSVVGTRSDNQPLNAPYPVGTTTITWKATDIHGNIATDTQTITVTDAQAPSVLASVAVAVLGPPFNHALINVGLSATVSDNCGAAATQVSVYSDEDDGTGPHSPDAVDIGLGTLKLRRERDGGSNGRVYLIVVKATDSSGNSAVSCKTVVVPKSNTSADMASVNAQATAAATFCQASNGSAPAGYFPVGP